MNPQALTTPRGVRTAWTVYAVLTLAGLVGGGAVTLHGIRSGWTAWHWAGIALISLAPLLSSRLAMRWVPEMRPAMRRYNGRLTATMVVYVLLLMGGVELARRGLTAGPWGYVVAIATALPTLNVFVVIGRLVREETDELQRHIVLMALFWSGTASLVEAMVWGFLEMFGKAPHVFLFAVPIMFFVQLGVTMPLAARRYR